MSDESIALARRITGEAGQYGREQLPVIKFIGRQSPHGDENNFYLLTKNEDTGELDSELLGQEIGLVILKNRKSADNNDSTNPKYIYEFDDIAQPVFLKHGDAKPVEGTYKQFKEQHPDLQYREVLYISYEKKICKMKIKGGSLDDFWTYCASIASNDSIMRHITHLKGKLVRHPKGDYYALTFTREGENPDFMTMLGDIQKVALPKPPRPEITPPAPPEEEINIDDVRI